MMANGKHLSWIFTTKFKADVVQRDEITECRRKGFLREIRDILMHETAFFAKEIRSASIL